MQRARRRSDALLITDTTPAVFWVTHPNNTYINNRAAGSTNGYGYWCGSPFATRLSLDPKQHPQRSSCDLSIWFPCVRPQVPLPQEPRGP